MPDRYGFPQRDGWAPLCRGCSPPEVLPHRCVRGTPGSTLCYCKEKDCR